MFIIIIIIIIIIIVIIIIIIIIITIIIYCIFLLLLSCLMPSLCVPKLTCMLNYFFFSSIYLIIQWYDGKPEAELFGKIVKVNIQCKGRQAAGESKQRDLCIVFKVNGYTRSNQCCKYIL